MFENNRQKKISEIVLIVKLISVLFCGVIIAEYHFMDFISLENIFSSYGEITIVIISFILFILVYLAWAMHSEQSESKDKYLIRRIIEITALFIFFSYLIMLSGGHTSEYKFIFLFIIIATTIQYGMKSGMIVSGISSAIVLTIDLFSLPLDTVNSYFETDLILSGIFMLASWLLGYYVKIENEYRARMSNLISLDELTGLYNHRFFQETIGEQINISRDNTQPLSLLLIDIDSFRRYNELFGLTHGDMILLKFGKMLKSSVRQNDIATRFGGDEFAVILPNTDEKAAHCIAEKLREIVEKTDFGTEIYQDAPKVTVSIGVACYPSNATSKSELINCADDALYRAKYFKMNRVESYSSILEKLKIDAEDNSIDVLTSIKTIISLINAKDRYTYGHVERVVMLCDILSEKLGLSNENKNLLKLGAYLHDIGKLEIPRDILNKKTSLTNDEWDLIMRHPTNGAEMIKNIEPLQGAISIVKHHHEKYNGTGYPDNLQGEEIPYLARILTVVDSFDAMTSNRPYVNSMTFGEAINELVSNKGIHFDPDITDVFIKLIIENKSFIDKIK